MAAIDPTRALASVAGRLVLGPSNAGMASGVYPYGSSTPIGLVSRWREVREQVYAWENSEARARDAVAGYGGRYKASFTFVLVQYDPTVLEKLYAFSNTSPNGYSGASILTLPKAGLTSLAPGLLATQSPLLFAADDPSHPSTLILAPILCLPPKLELDETLDKPFETSVVVVAGIDANGNDIRRDKLENLSTS